MNSVPVPGRSPCLTCKAFTTIPPPTTPRTPDVALARYPSAHRAISRLRHSLAGSPVRQAESSSLSCGLVVHLLLLPTPPRGDAVAVGYRLESVLPGEDFHLSDHARLQAHESRLQAVLLSRARRRPRERGTPNLEGNGVRSTFFVRLQPNEELAAEVRLGRLSRIESASSAIARKGGSALAQGASPGNDAPQPSAVP